MSIKRISTGVPGLDEILFGGLISNQTYLVKGQPGSGKTTLGLHFLGAGISQEEKCLLIAFSESKTSLHRNAERIGIDIERLEILDLSPSADVFSKDLTYDIFSPSEIEKAPTTQKIIEAIEKIKPERIFLDAITQFRFLATDAFQFRREI